MDRRNQESKAGGLSQSTRPPALPVTSARPRSITPFLAAKKGRLETERSSGTFRVPSPTSSDEAEIEAQERLLLQVQRCARPEPLQASSGPTTPDVDQLAVLLDSSSLFSHTKTGSPTSSNIFKFGSPEADVKSPFLSPLPHISMVVERDPPNVSPQKTAQKSLPDVQQPVFGQPSPIRNKLQPKPPSVFNIPKPHQKRPEHHRPLDSVHLSQSSGMGNGQSGHTQPTTIFPLPQPQPTGGGHLSQTQSTSDDLRQAANTHNFQPRPQPTFLKPFLPAVKSQSQHQGSGPQPAATTRKTFGDPDVVEIARPANAPMQSSYPRPQPAFSAYGSHNWGFALPNGSFTPIIVPGQDYTSTNASSDPPGLFNDQFGASDPNLYIEATKATENIKALLEGAFDDDEDKPKTRGQKERQKEKNDEKIGGLLDKLKGLAVNKLDNQEGDHNHEAEDDEDEDDGSVEGLKVKLLPHQVEGVEWMRDKEIGIRKKNGVLPKGGILADDMGLGKTIQSISLILTNPRPPVTANASSKINKKSLSPNVGRNTLVVAPLALIKQWEAEIKTKVEDSHTMKVLVHHGPQRTKSFQDLKRYDVVITTYQILVSEHGNSSTREDGPQVGCFGVHWYRVILDEAHTIKNRNAKSTQACYALRTEYRWCLTGTPMQNNLDELQSLIKFLKIKPYNELSVWKDQITRPLSQGRGGVAMKRLQFYLKAFMKRRTKEVLKKEGALNPGGKPTSAGGSNNGFKITERKVESLVAEFSPHERAFYDRLEQRTDKSLEAMMDGAKMSYANALVLLLRLRQACNHPKLLAGSLSKDSDALTTGQTSPSKSAKAADKDIDDMAALLGGLSVETRQCDICQIDLSREEVSAGLIRCSECEGDLADQKTGSARDKVDTKKNRNNARASKIKSKAKNRASRVQKNRNVVVDSDGEDEGDWLVPEDQRHAPNLGRAGGSDDENAEGGGESLASLDTETGDESSLQIIESRRRKIGNQETNDEAKGNSDISSSDEEEEEDASDSEDSSEATPVASAKIRRLLAILRPESATHKFIVYSQFTSMLDLIEPFLRSAKLSFTRYDGSMRNDRREASLEKLRHDPSCRILLCSLKCGSLGLNLTAASRVVILEPFWNPFVEEQAIDRVHRLNQTVDVVVYKLTIKDTVEARILDLQEKKRALANAAIEGKAVSKLSMKDILNLFKRDAEHDSRHDADPTLVETKTAPLIGGASSDSRVVGSNSGSSDRSTPSVMEKPKGGVKRGEDAIYGRRW